MVLCAVDFDDEPCFPAEEIDDIAFYDILALDLHRKTLQTIIPEERLLRRHVAPHLTRTVFQKGILTNEHN